MGNLVLKAENVSKYYRLGVIGSGSLKEDIQNLWTGTFSPKHKKVRLPTDKANANELWALKDINFEIMQGDVVGFVGKNGAGKSTLLKVLSRITLPTIGSIKGKGRIASLLEVGTGFHAELTGRENIFLNGQILGMNKKEIVSKFDEIVDFSGIEQFLDTPVKRYSSGMYVRLAFAIAAHIDPDILIVDEVLAVGDAEFQKKCLGKMKQVSTEEGKTVLFVSHNAQALKNLCTKAIYLEKGSMIDIGRPNDVIANYLKREQTFYLSKIFADPDAAPGNENIRIKRVEMLPQYLDTSNIIDIRTPLIIEFEFWYSPTEEMHLGVNILLNTVMGECIFDVASLAGQYTKGLIKGKCTIPGDFLNNGSYSIDLLFVKNTSSSLFDFEECLSFDVEDFRENTAWYGEWVGAVRPKFKVQLQQDGF
ncbi:lipopolysaccharide transport system ATP-binding protein [Pedobacter sp. AK017]|uniref:ABC transporter ATP-binding protein n=1 Tax=Pedobacter sp. AK017 TaxID=2723073 RepID=UPI00161CF5E5|nr:ABC transporter ATP-binding protein [Pedobacter sp. AK017]MBB5440364.1 lipopolysaccharide transport system ATP-binding protein [Pedobacter sp. AK017]